MILNRKLEISTAYSQALIQNKIDRWWVRSRESGRQTVRQLWGMVFEVEVGRRG